ncbi:hypothetical protein [Methanolobus profundi]|uniref:hypothetical protein n=1 Tax=Methanolobus profundi TaxID=487685 RepID=UPI000B87BAC9|nr:hypothetical protein [Methanolobus profundi]
MISGNEISKHHPPKATPSFPTILKTIEIIQLLKITDFKVLISRISKNPKNRNEKVALNHFY